VGAAAGPVRCWQRWDTTRTTLDRGPISHIDRPDSATRPSFLWRRILRTFTWTVAIDIGGNCERSRQLRCTRC
jgi:hypothetical protein